MQTLTFLSVVRADSLHHFVLTSTAKNTRNSKVNTTLLMTIIRSMNKSCNERQSPRTSCKQSFPTLACKNNAFSKYSGSPIKIHFKQEFSTPILTVLHRSKLTVSTRSSKLDFCVTKVEMFKFRNARC